jgi:hypothetical protein
MILNELEAEYSSIGSIEIHHSIEMISIAGILQQLFLFSQVTHLGSQGPVRQSNHDLQLTSPVIVMRPLAVRPE